MDGLKLLPTIRATENSVLMIAKGIVRTMEDYFSSKSNIFRVSIEESNRKIDDGTTFNSAACVIGRTLIEAEKYGKVYIGSEDWDKNVSKLIEKQIQEYSQGEPEAILPLRSFGILPAFSVVNLLRFLQSAHITDSFAFEIGLCRICKILNELSHWKNAVRINADSHPYLLYGYYFVLKSSKPQITQKSIKLNINDPKFDAIATAAKTDKSGLVDYLFQEEIDSNLVDVYCEMLETLAHHKALAQLEISRNQDGADYDPASLLFSVSLLENANKKKYRDLISRALRTIITTMEPSGAWKPALPFYVDSKARALYVTSIQIARLLTAEFASSETHMNGDHEQILGFLKKFNFWLEEHRIGIDFDGKNCTGWCSDDAPASERIDSWITVHTLEYAIDQLRLLENLKKSIILNEYNHVKFKVDNNNRPKPNPTNVYNLIDVGNHQLISHDEIANMLRLDKELAPTFILYGPPGTSKTTFAEQFIKSDELDLLRLSPSDFIAKGIEHIESRSREIFDHLENLHKTIILFDEMDSLLRDRAELEKRVPGSMLSFVVPAFLPKLQTLRDYSIKKKLIVILITNYFGNIDSAIKRKGRFDNHFLMLPMSSLQRANFISHTLVNTYNCHFTFELGKEIENLLNNQYAIRLLGYRQNLELVQKIFKCIENDKIADIQKCFVYPEITADFYEPSRNPNGNKEFLEVYNFLFESKGVKLNSDLTWSEMVIAHNKEGYELMHSIPPWINLHTEIYK